MHNKHHLLTALHEEFNRWEAMLASLSEAQITAAQLPKSWSIRFREAALQCLYCDSAAN